MQKFTWDELWRIGLVASPGFNTVSETAVPGAKAFPAPASGFTIIEIRRPFAGAGSDARRSTSASIASLGTTTGGISLTGSAADPVRSRN